MFCFKKQRSVATRSQAPPADPADDAREYYSAKRRRQPKQPEPVLVKNSGNSLSALATLATHADSSEERSAAHWSDVDDSDSDLEENKLGKKRGIARMTEKKPRRSDKRHGGDSSRLVWTEDMVGSTYVHIAQFVLFLAHSTAK